MIDQLPDQTPVTDETPAGTPIVRCPRCPHERGCVGDSCTRWPEIGAQLRSVPAMTPNQRGAVLLLLVPAEDVCGAEPTLDWRSGSLRETWPTAVGVSQCALTPGHDSPMHVGMLWVLTGGDRPAVCYPTQVGFRT